MYSLAYSSCYVTTLDTRKRMHRLPLIGFNHQACYGCDLFVKDFCRLHRIILVDFCLPW